MLESSRNRETGGTGLGLYTAANQSAAVTPAFVEAFFTVSKFAAD
jgi:hypothetical protein